MEPDPTIDLEMCKTPPYQCTCGVVEGCCRVKGIRGCIAAVVSFNLCEAGLCRCEYRERSDRSPVC